MIIGNETIERGAVQIQWLDLRDQADQTIYKAWWDASRFRRPHDHPGVLDLMKPAGYSSAAVLYHAPGKGSIVYPFFWCQLNRLPAFAALPEQFSHMVSPYGYGGALYEGDPHLRESASAEFESLLASELRRRGFVSEFVREDIFSSRLAIRSEGHVIMQQPNVVVRLERSDDDIWRTYRPKVRKNVARAKDCGLRVVFDAGGEYLGEFMRIYLETMQRTAAAKSFLIPREQFEQLGRAVGPDGGLMYVHVFDGADCISTELLLLSSDAVYSFLGGTVAAAYDKRPNDLLKHEVILWAREKGLAWYVLGGGVTPGDGIFKYKESFDRDGIMPFHVRRVVHRQEAYDLMIAKRRHYEQAQGNDWCPRPDYFPEYLS